MAKMLKGPYFNTSLEMDIDIQPRYINKQIEKNKKIVLESKILNKCFEDYGYVCKIYGITKSQGGKIHLENGTCPAIYRVSFNCKICRPYIGEDIIMEIDKINMAAISLINGPIKCFIFEDDDKINNDNFAINNVITARIVKKTMKPLVKGDHVKIKVIDYRINKDDILIIGMMNDIASPEEIRESNNMKEYEEQLEQYVYEEYVKVDTEIEDTLTDKSNNLEDVIQ